MTTGEVNEILAFRDLEAEARVFVEKVESGMARSVRTYGAFRRILARLDEVRGENK